MPETDCEQLGMEIDQLVSEITMLQQQQASEAAALVATTAELVAKQTLLTEKQNQYEQDCTESMLANPQRMVDVTESYPLNVKLLRMLRRLLRMLPR